MTKTRRSAKNTNSLTSKVTKADDTGTQTKVVEMKKTVKNKAPSTGGKTDAEKANAHLKPNTPERTGGKKQRPGAVLGGTGATPNRIKDLKQGKMDTDVEETETPDGKSNSGHQGGMNSSKKSEENPNPPKKDGDDGGKQDGEDGDTTTTQRATATGSGRDGGRCARCVSRSTPRTLRSLVYDIEN